MGSANLEVFKFATYLFVPVFAMLHFGDPNWFEKHVKPYKDVYWPPYEETHKPPRTASELQDELAKFRAEKLGQPSPKNTTTAAREPSRSGTSTTALGEQSSGSARGTSNGFGWAAGDRRLV